MRVFSLLLCVLGQNLNEPTDGKHYLAAWIDTADSVPNANDGERPYKFNQKMGFNMSAYQYAQNLPIDTFSFPVEQIEVLDTDTIIYLTVYPRPSPWSISDADIKSLTQDLGNLNRQKRRVLLRFAPEFNGNWNSWGMQPTRFLALWNRVHAALKEDAPLTAMVWAPSSGNGYPYGGPMLGGPLSDEDLALLDTNKNGRLDTGDDPYSPYYPGDDKVDWVGSSIYHYGSNYPWQDNVIPAPGKFESFLNVGNFYREYSLSRNKPMMVAETGSTFHRRFVAGNRTIAPGPGELAIKQAWWRQFITNTTFLDAYPKVKMFCLFEFEKEEELTLRDWRIAQDPAILKAFQDDFKAVQGRYLLANGSGIVTGSGNGNKSGSGADTNMARNLLVVMIASLFLTI